MNRDITCRKTTLNKGVHTGAVFLAILFGTAGCQNTTGARDNDPLFGGGGAPYLGRQAPPPPAGAVSRTRNEVPPLPSAPANRSLAALTNGATEARPDDRRTPAVGASLHAPQPVRGTTTANAGGGVTQIGFTEAVNAADGFEQLQRKLLTRGVQSQRLRTTTKAGEWHFHCTIPDPENPNLRLNFEATAAGPYGLAAMRAVIEKIDQERTR